MSRSIGFFGNPFSWERWVKKFRNKTINNSLRFLIKNNLNLYDNVFPRNSYGESNLDLEVILLGNKDILENLITCEKLDELYDYRLFV